MESVLHIEPITRQLPAPLSVGHNEYLFYGETLTIDDDNVGDVTSAIQLGSPLDMGAFGSHERRVPLVKTVEYMPDLSRDQGNTYIESLYLLKDKKTLIPYRSKMRVGLGDGMRVSHLPSLNLARKIVAGSDHQVCDPRSEIVYDVLLKDEVFQRRKNQPLRDWLMYELATMLDHNPINTMTFDPGDINDMIPNYINQVRDTPSEFNHRHLKDIARTMSITTSFENLVTPRYFSNTSLEYPVGDARARLVNHTGNFQSLGTIPVAKIPRLDYNPRRFQDICDTLDAIPLTDFNVDLVISIDDEIVFYQEHLALNRFSVFADNDVGRYRPETHLRNWFDARFLNKVLEKFTKYHCDMSDELYDLIMVNMVKIKIIKTMSDEAAILLYAFDSGANDLPLCGVYFDIALQALAPMSVIPIPIAN